jgi:hypothetical protein
MLTMENTEGFNQSELDTINKEVARLLEYEYPEYKYMGYEEQYEKLQWAEEKILKMYGGA